MDSLCKQDKKYVRFSWEQLELRCEWAECETVTDQLHTYLQHVDSHLESITEESECCWKECSGYNGAKMDLTTHVLFHAFHTKIKCFGKNLLKRKNIGICSFDQRARNIIPDISEMECQWEGCGISFLSPETFYRHVDSHAEDNPKGNNLAVVIDCKWQDCTSNFNSLYRLKEHMRCHTQERVMACPTCGSMFASRTKFFDHVKRQKGGTSTETSFQCGYCSRRMASERLLRDHMRHHINHYKCPYCDMTCPTPSGIRRHILYRHNENKLYKCAQCDYRAKCLNDLRRHMERHSGDLDYSCDVEDCTFRTNSSVMLNKHMRTAHDCDVEYPSFLCHICQKKFSRGHNLTKHLVRQHHLRWPSGHCRFRYHRQDDGFFKLQTVRYESIDLSEAILEDEAMDEPSPSNNDVSQSAGFQQANPTQAEEGSEDKMITLPMVVFVSDNNALDKSHLEAKTDEQSLSMMELQTTDGNTYITPDGSSVVYVNIQEPGGTSSALRTIQFVTKGDDGTTTVQMAEVIAEGDQSSAAVQL